MVISNRLKQIIFNKLYKDLSKIEIISYGNSIWFIDRENEYWYLEYEKNGKLWWRHGFFESFFVLFSLELNDYQPIISEWVEEVLNCKVNTPAPVRTILQLEVEEVLNCKVNTPYITRFIISSRVEEVLNCKVNTPSFDKSIFRRRY
jgi:hypothetical protein